MPDLLRLGLLFPGSPLATLTPALFRRGGGAPPNRAPVPPPAPGTGKDRPLLRRIPAPDDPNYARRVSEFSELLTDAFNALVRHGTLVREAPADWTLDVSGVAGGTDGLTGTFSDGTFQEGPGGATGTFSDGDFAGFAPDGGADGPTGTYADGVFP